MGPKNVTRDDIRSVGNGIANDVPPHLETALDHVREAQGFNSDAFTATTITYASAYTGAVEYAIQDIQTKIEDADNVHDNLHQVADNWDEAEQENTISEDA